MSTVDEVETTAGPTTDSGEDAVRGSTPAQSDIVEAQAEAFQVLVRVRPPLGSEVTDDQAIEVTGSSTLKLLTEKHEVSCTYDKVLNEHISQAEVYETIAPRVRAVLSGVNSTIFAYGQTGSGKTYTMLGKDLESEMVKGKPISETDTDDWGVIPRAIVDVFTCLNDSLGGGEVSAANSGGMGKEAHDMAAVVHCSYMQIYNNQLFDLLADPSRSNNLKIRESVGPKSKKSEIFVQGLSEYRVSSASDVLLLLQHGSRNRAVRATQYNEQSSRSHAILQMTIETSIMKPNGGRVVRVAKLNCVDLAGSEKWNTWTTMKKRHQKELTEINTSLSALGICIQRLTEPNHSHVPYRDSVLTRLLEDSLGGNTKTSVIATVSPSAYSAEDSMSTLQFADRARQVMVRVKPNQIVDNKQKLISAEREITRLKKVVDALRDQLREAGVEPRNFDQAMMHRENLQLKEENAELRERIEDLESLQGKKRNSRGGKGRMSRKFSNGKHKKAAKPSLPQYQHRQPMQFHPSGKATEFPPVFSRLSHMPKENQESADQLIKPLTSRSNQDDSPERDNNADRVSKAPELTRAMVGIARARESNASSVNDENEDVYGDDFEQFSEDESDIVSEDSVFAKGLPGFSALAARLEMKENRNMAASNSRRQGPESVTPIPTPMEKGHPYAAKQKIPDAKRRTTPTKKRRRKKKKKKRSSNAFARAPISANLEALHQQMMKDVGKRIRVHFARYDEWYKGTIVGIDAERRMHCIQYDNGGRKWCKMEMRKYQLLKKKGHSPPANGLSHPKNVIREEQNELDTMSPSTSSSVMMPIL